MKILHTVENYYPSVGGSQEVVRQISERLAGLGHDVTVATSRNTERNFKSYNGVGIIGFDVHGKSATGYGGKEINEYRQFLLESRFDVMMNYAAQQWATDLAFEVIDNIKAAKVLVPCGFSGLYRPDYSDYFKLMPEVLKKYDATVYMSDDYRDVNFARQHSLKNTHLIPNGAGEDEFSQSIDIDIRKKLGIPSKDFLILLVGTHTGLKGHIEAMEIFLKAKIKNSTLLIIANDFGTGCSQSCKSKTSSARLSLSYRLARKQLIIKDFPRRDTVAAYKTANLFLFPSRIEASPLVLFEAMASQVAFLTTDVGNSVEIIKWSDGGLLLPTVKDEEGYSHAEIDKSARLLEQLYNDRSQLNHLAAKGYATWKRRFTWEKITKQYEQLYKNLMKK